MDPRIRRLRWRRRLRCCASRPRDPDTDAGGRRLRRWAAPERQRVLQDGRRDRPRAARLTPNRLSYVVRTDTDKLCGRQHGPVRRDQPALSRVRLRCRHARRIDRSRRRLAYDADSRSAVRGARDDRCRDRPPLRGNTKTGGTLTHGLKGTVDWRVTGRLAAGSTPATILTVSWASRATPLRP